MSKLSRSFVRGVETNFSGLTYKIVKIFVTGVDTIIINCSVLLFKQFLLLILIIISLIQPLNGVFQVFHLAAFLLCNLRINKMDTNLV